MKLPYTQYEIDGIISYLSKGFDGIDIDDFINALKTK
jgi:hypothetical protein